jgi:hypothetical protein
MDIERREFIKRAGITGLGWEGQVYFVGICIFAKIIERKKGYCYRVCFTSSAKIT